MRYAIPIVVLALGCGAVHEPPTTEIVDTSGDGTSTTGDTTAGDPSSSDDTSSSDDGAQSPAQAACGDWCAATIACGADVDVFLCELDCAADLAALLDVPDCPPARIAVLECAAELGCAALHDLELVPEQSECAELVLAADEVCDPSCAPHQSYGDPAEASCGATFRCGTTDRAIDCVETQCTCSVAGEPVAACEGGDVCISGVELDAGFVQDCCGWSDLLG